MLDFTEEDLRAIIARSLYLHERIELHRSGGAHFDESGRQATEFLDTWERLVSGGNRSKFDRRLAWDGYDRTTIQKILGTVQLPDDFPTPRWITSLLRVQSEIKGLVPESGLPDAEFVDERRPLAFEHFLLPFVSAASDDVSRSLGNLWASLAPAARHSCQRHLLSDLSRCATAALMEEFDSFRFNYIDGNDLFLGRVSAGYSQNLYTIFVRRLLTVGFQPFLKRYAVLARILGTRMQFWTAFISELIRHFDSDKQEISLLTGTDCVLEKIAEISLALSDSHNSARSVSVITFCEGSKIVYKPRDLAIDTSFNGFLDWINHANRDPLFATLRVIKRTGYGWTQFVEHKSCESEQQFSAFFRRCGMLLGVVHFLQGCDCHLENVIASENWPYLVDAETLVTPQIEDLNSNDEPMASVVATRRLARSVLNTGFLPQWTVTPEGLSLDYSALGAEKDSPISSSQFCWTGINSDTMTAHRRPPSRGSVIASLPFVDGSKPPHLTAFEREIVDGYQRLYAFFLDQANVLSRLDGPLRSFQGIRVRLLVRATTIYSDLLFESLSPACCREGIARSISLDRLAQTYISRRNMPTLWAACRSEHEALQNCDIPHFSLLTCDLALLPAESPPLFNVLGMSAYSHLLRSIADLSMEDCQWQVSFIKTSIKSKRIQLASIPQALDPQMAGLGSVDLLGDDRLLSAGTQIAEHLLARRIAGDDKTASWIGMEYDTRGGVFHVKELSATSLYSGIPGICLFFGAAYAITRREEFREVALAGMSSVRRAIYLPSIGKALPIGGFTGIGGLLYCLVCLSELLDHPEFLDDAQYCTSFFTEEKIDIDSDFDVVSGSAGALLALVKFYQATGNVEALKTILLCGNHLVQESHLMGDGSVCWQSLNSNGSRGFAHGVSGIAWALVNAWRVTNEETFRAIAVKGLAFEPSIFNVREPERARIHAEAERSHAMNSPNAWCYGIPGIALARTGILGIVEELETRKELESAINRIGFVQAQGYHLCCGEMGVAEILLEIGRRLGNDEILESGRMRITKVLRSFGTATNAPVVPLGPFDADVPGLMQGIAGVGYSLMHYVDGNSKLPALLLLA